MGLLFPTLRELSMRVVLLEELPWEEELEGLPMKKELEALDRLPGEYKVIKTSREIIKGGTLSQGEARSADKLAGKVIFKKGKKISISKEMGRDPVVMWRIYGRKVSYPIFFSGFPLQQTPSRVSEAGFTGMVEMKRCYTLEGIVGRGSYCFMVDGKGKLELNFKSWQKLKSRGVVELIDTAVAQRD